MNRKLRFAAKSRQAHSDSEESRSKVNQCDGNEHSRQQQWRYGQSVRHCFAEQDCDIRKQGQDRATPRLL